MNSYAIYRIAETIRVLLFMTLSILVFNFYPVTAVMIVLLALLNDGAILSIAYDRVQYSDQPEAWNMRNVLGIATVLGLAGVVCLVRAVLPGRTGLPPEPRGDSDADVSETLGRRPPHDLCYPHPRAVLVHPARASAVLSAVIGTQLIATCFAVFGWLMPPIGWGWALAVWGYALAWFLVNDRVKLAAYRILDPKQSALAGRK